MGRGQGARRGGRAGGDGARGEGGKPYLARVRDFDLPRGSHATVIGPEQRRRGFAVGDSEGHGALERRLVSELRELLGLPSLKISVTCVQVPVFFGDSFSVAVQSRRPVDLAAVNQALEAADSVELVERDDYPTPVGDAVGQDVVYVGRVRHGVDEDQQLNLWLTTDNVRKGAALNAVQLAELLIKDLA